MRTPWGMSDGQEDMGSGIFFHSTPGHGGAKVPAKLNRLIPEPLRCSDGWYEEDCDISIVIYFLNDRLLPKWHGEKELALDSIKRWNLIGWDVFSGEDGFDGWIWKESKTREDYEKAVAKLKAPKPKTPETGDVVFFPNDRFSCGDTFTVGFCTSNRSVTLIALDGKRYRMSKARLKKFEFTVSTPQK